MPSVTLRFRSWRVAILGVVPLLCVLGPRHAAAVESQWLGTSGPLWFTPSNWLPAGVPNAADAEVRFDLPKGPTETVEIFGSPVTVSKFTFDQAGTNYNLVGFPPAHFLLPPGGTVVDVVSGQHRISADILGDQSLTKTGAGQLTLDRQNLYTGDTVIEAGTLVLDDSMFPDQELQSTNLIVGSGAGIAATLDVTSFSIYEIASARRLTGHGTVMGFAMNHGTVAPGGSEPGILEIFGDYIQSLDGTLEIQIGGLMPGAEHDQLDVNAAADLAGKLELSRTDAGSGLFEPTVGDSVAVLTAAPVVGQFDSISFLNPLVGVAADVTYTPTAVNVVFVNPEPANYVEATTGSFTWDNPGIWNLGGSVPALKSVVDLNNASLMAATMTVRVDNHAFAHTVDISGSTAPKTMTLHIETNQSLSATHGVTVESNGILAGFGTVVGNVENSSGTVSPGDASRMGSAIGELTIDGQFDQSGGGALHIDVGATVADKLTATGDITLSGALELNLVGSPPAIGQQFTIVEADGQLTGVFGNVDGAGMGVFISYDEHSVNYGSTYMFDMDMNGTLDGDDIDDFVLGLLRPDIYRGLHMKVDPWMIGSADNDFILDYDDIEPFENALQNENISVSIAKLIGVPEPSTFQLLLMGALAILYQRRLDST